MTTIDLLLNVHKSAPQKMKQLLPFFILFLHHRMCLTKYIEGRLKTSDNWAFLARFCFLSEEGQFEYFLEYNEEQGIPNLLLYYDTDDQWPAVYKTGKTCYEKESVLHVEQNQIINLTTTHGFLRDLSGCNFKQNRPSVLPTTTTTTTTTTKPLKMITVVETTPFTENPDYSTTVDANSQWEIINETDLATPSTHKVPIKKRALKPTHPLIMSRSRSVICHNARKFRSARERWWFIALSNCNGTKGIDIKYKILMTNGPPGDYWHEHFSADEFYILPILMAFSIAYSFLLLGIIICSIELKSRQLLHTTYKIFVFSVIFQLFGIILASAAYLKYAINGLGPSKIKRVGAMFMGASETLYLLLLLLLAKGFTITRGRLPLSASIKLTIFMCLYVVTYISIFVYEANVFDPGEVLYLYESPAGYSLIILRVLAWCMFVYSTVFTLKHYPEKSNFYYPFNVCGTLWFIAGPAFILSANSYIDKWIRESVVCAVLQFITFGGHLTFLILTMPSVANKNFPYHVRTTQIGVMELTGTAGGSTIEQFGHHIYEPSGTVRESTVIVPLTRRTEEIFEGMYNQPINRMNHDDDARNLMMENVINWSLAKNVTALEIPNFERINRSSFASTNSKPSDGDATPPLTTTPNQNGHFDDYIRDVPIQLFTISRMVAGTNSNSHDLPNGKIL